jgi:hypothetical protein
VQFNAPQLEAYFNDYSTRVDEIHGSRL